MRLDSFPAALKYIESLIPATRYKFPAELGLQRIGMLLESLDNPQNSFKALHIAGTSGKGSTAYLISLILSAQNIKVGLHLSPHLQTIRERFIINNILASENDFISLANKVAPHITAISAQCSSPVTYFEALLAMVFVYFKQQKVAYGVIETGLGGTYDGTNVLNSLVTVITKIGFDHTAILGNTITKIAQQKAGIIKAGNLATISQNQIIDAQKVIRDVTSKLQVPLLTAQADFAAVDQQLLSTHSLFTYQDKDTFIKEIKLPLIGAHQIENCITAIQTVLTLKRHGLAIDTDKIKSALQTAAFPGRMEKVKIDSNNWILDGAHNEDKLKSTTATLSGLFKDKPKIAIIGFKKDKDIDTCLKILMPQFHTIICTQPKSLTDMGINLATDPQELKKSLVRLGYRGEISVEDKIVNATAVAKKILKRDQLCVVTGSLYVVGEVRTALELQFNL